MEKQIRLKNGMGALTFEQTETGITIQGYTTKKENKVISSLVLGIGMMAENNVLIDMVWNYVRQTNKGKKDVLSEVK